MRLLVVLGLAAGAEGLRIDGIGVHRRCSVAAVSHRRAHAPRMETVAEKKARLQAKRAAAAAEAADGAAAAAAEKAGKDQAQKEAAFTDSVFFDMRTLHAGTANFPGYASRHDLKRHAQQHQQQH